MRLNRRVLYDLIEKISRRLLIPSTEKLAFGWSGDFKSWSEAQKKTSGYDTGLILNKVKESLLKVKNGEAIFERDSVIFNEIQYSWGVLSALLYAGMKNKGKLNVLDFGGSLGSGYFQNRKVLRHLNSLRWSIIEQSHFVTTGKENFQNEELKFYHDYCEYSQCQPTPDLLLISSVLQYIEKPFELLEGLLSHDIDTIVIDITTFIVGDRDLITIQRVPPSIYEASYPCWFFNRNSFIEFICSKGYKKVGEWKNDTCINKGYLAGMIFSNNKI